MNKFLQIGALACFLMSSTNYVEAGLFGPKELKAKSEEAQAVYDGDYQVITKALNDYQTQVKNIQKYISKLANAGKSGNNALTKDFSKSLDDSSPNAAFSVCLMMVMNSYSALTAYTITAAKNLSNSLTKFAKSTKTPDVAAQGKIIIECAERFRAAAYMSKIASEGLSKFLKLNSKIAGRAIIGKDAVTKVLAQRPLPDILKSCKRITAGLQEQFSSFEQGESVHIADDVSIINTSLQNIYNSFVALSNFVDVLTSFVNGSRQTVKIKEAKYINAQDENKETKKRSQVSNEDYDDEENSSTYDSDEDYNSSNYDSDEDYSGDYEYDEDY